MGLENLFEQAGHGIFIVNDKYLIV